MKNLYQKINDIQKTVKSVHKGGTVKINERASYSAVLHDDVTALLHDPIANAGIVAMPRMETCEVEIIRTSKSYNGQITESNSYMVKIWASVTFINSENPSEQYQTQCFAYAIDSGDKATGKAYSMAIKYCYLKTFMLESCDDEESRDYENTWKNEPAIKQLDVVSTSKKLDQSKPLPVKSPTPKPTFIVEPTTEQKPVQIKNPMDKASDAQKGALTKMGIYFSQDITKSEASKLIESANKERKEGR
jgi:hypothetical protein